MSRKKPVKIVINDIIEVEPDGVYCSSVVKSGNGAVIKFYKKFIGKKVVVIVEEKMKNKEEELTEEEEKIMNFENVSKKKKKELVDKLSFCFTV